MKKKSENSSRAIPGFGRLVEENLHPKNVSFSEETSEAFKVSNQIPSLIHLCPDLSGVLTPTFVGSPSFENKAAKANEGWNSIEGIFDNEASVDEHNSPNKYPYVIHASSFTNKISVLIQKKEYGMEGSLFVTQEDDENKKNCKSIGCGCKTF